MPLLQSMYPIIDKISPFYNLVEHYLSPFLQKEAGKKCYKCYTL
jgi:hypothetical protein